MVHNKKELKRIDWSIVKRIMKLLYYDSRIKKTNIAMKCNMNYGKLSLYLDWLELLEFISKVNENGFKVITLNEKGREFYSRKINPDEETLLV